MTVHEVERPAYGRHRADTSAGERRVTLRRDGSCSLCGTVLPARTTAVADPGRGTVRCVDCEGSALLAAAARHREPALGGAHAATHVGAGEDTVSPADLRQRLDLLRDHDVRLLHGRRVPGSSTTLDHLVVTPGGVWVVTVADAAGEPRVVLEGGRLRHSTERLVVGRRTCTRLVDTALRLASTVAEVAGADVPVHPVVCLVPTEGPAAGTGLTTRGTAVVGPAGLVDLLARSGDAGVDVPAVRQRLAVAFRVV